MTRRGLSQVVGLPDAVRAVDLGYSTGGMVAAVRGAVKLDAGMVQEAVPKTGSQAPSARPWVRALTRAWTSW